MMQFILFLNFAAFFTLFKLNPRELYTYLLWREHAPYTGNETNRGSSLANSGCWEAALA
jgi:hypothetical protein